MSGKMYSVSKLAATSATILILIVGVVVDARLPKKKLVSPPECTGISSKDYNEDLRHLHNFFVDETKNTFRKPGADYVYDHSYPNRDTAGSVNGVAICNRQLNGMDCWSCLATIKKIINSRCDRPLSGSVRLQDCSITFKAVS